MIVTYTVRARYGGEVLEPLESLDDLALEEGDEIPLTLARVLPPYVSRFEEEGSGLEQVARDIYERRNSPWVVSAAYVGGRFKLPRPLDYEEGEEVWLTVGRVPSGELVPGESVRIFYRLPTAAPVPSPDAPRTRTL